MNANFLFYDIETSPIFTEEQRWSLWDEQPIKRRIIQDWQILTISWKWMGERKVHVLGQDDFKDYKPGKLNDKSLMGAIRDLFDQADVVIAHNGDKFDQRKSNTRTIINNLDPPSPYRSIDTRKVAKKYFGFTSNKLDDLGEFLGVGHKLPTGGYALWEGVMAGNDKDWRTMKRYNKQDVVLLEAVYYKLRPWMNNHPALNIMLENPDACPKCGSVDLKRNGLRFTQGGVYQEYQCRNCGGYCRARIMDKKPKMAFAN